MRIGMAWLGVVLLAGCSDDDSACGSKVVGSWTGTTVGDSITIESGGAFSYRGADGCVSKGSFSCPDASVTQGSMKVSVDSSSGGTCLPAGDYSCQFALNGNAMAYNCGGGALQYKRQ